MFIFLTFKEVSSQNVIIAVIDGLRYSEGFGDEDTNLPNIWNNMRPYGTIYTEFWIDNDSNTVTMPGHASILTGTWQTIANDGTEYPNMPTVFEYYNKEFDDGIPPNPDTYLITGFAKLDRVLCSTHPDYGPDYQAINGTGDFDDPTVYTDVIAAMDDDSPRLILANFGDVDKSAHTGNWSNYIQDIKEVDQHIWNLWQYIQSDDNYKFNTTLFVTTDHGRHLDGVGDGWPEHGCDCDGCRHVFLLAIGYRAAAGQEISDYREQRDIAPTVGDIIGFSTPYATGTSLFIGDNPLPVELAAFQATPGENSITLEWTTESETNNLGFKIERSLDINREYREIASYLYNEDLQGKGNSHMPSHYSYVDHNILAGNSYFYRLIDVDFNGQETVHGPIKVILDVNRNSRKIPLELLPNFPNPFNATTQIRLQVFSDSDITNHSVITIYNNLGEIVIELFHGYLKSGKHEIDWDGRNKQGIDQPTGIYHVVLRNGEYSDHRKILLLR